MGIVIQVVTFAISACFYGAYFYKQIRLKKHGVHTNRLAKGSKPKRTAVIEGCLLAATYGTAAAQGVSVLFYERLLSLALPMPVRISGLALAFAGVVVFILAITEMRGNWRAGVDQSQSTQIVTSGIYKISRNPAFVGFDLLYIGTALALPSLILIGFSVACVILLHLQIIEEEAYLPIVFGEEYLRYKKDTPRYLFF